MYLYQLGVVFDKYLGITGHVNAVYKFTFYQLGHIAKIRKFISLESTRMFIYTSVTSKLDHCDALLYGGTVSEVKVCSEFCCVGNNIPCEMAFGIPRNKGVNFHGKLRLGIPRNS